MNWKTLVERTPAPLKRRPVLAGATLVALGLLWLMIRSPGNADAPTAFHEVRRGDLTVSVVEGGTLTAVSEVSIRNEVEGTARIIYIVPEGSYVKPGDLLVELDSAQAQDQVNQQQIAFEKAQFGLVQAEQQLKIQESAGESDIRAAELKLKFARLTLRKFLEGERLVNLLEATNNVAKTLAQLEVSRITYDYSVKLAANNYETKRTLDSDRLAVMNNEYQLLVASNKVWMLEEFDLPKQQEQYESDVKEAEKELERVKAQCARKLAQYEADLLTQSNTLVLNQKKLERDRKNLDATKIYAKQEGLVVYPVGENRFSSESLIEEGAVVRNRQELLKLPDTSRMKVTIRVHESHVNMVRPGQPAFVQLDSLPDQRFRGVVEKVALLPDTQSRWGNPNLKVYNTDVYITDKLPDIKPGGSARAEVIVTNIPACLSVPIQAVTTLRGRQVVYVVNGGPPEPRPVEVGMYNTKFIEIVSGLKEGERVLLSPPFDTQSKDLEGGVLAAEEKSQMLKSNGPPSTATSTPTRTGPAPAAAGRSARPGGAGRGGENAGTAGAGPTPGATRGRPVAGGEPGAGQVAEGGGGPGRAEGRQGGGRRGGSMPEEVIKQFDKDGDGQLNEEERTAAREAMRQRFGGQGGGPGGMGMDREALLKQFDKDGDGQISESEREAMREEMRRRFEGQNREGGGAGTPGRSDGERPAGSERNRGSERPAGPGGAGGARGASGPQG